MIHPLSSLRLTANWSPASSADTPKIEKATVYEQFGDVPEATADSPAYIGSAATGTAQHAAVSASAAATVIAVPILCIFIVLPL
jgi:hypothetical protein